MTNNNKIMAGLWNKKFITRKHEIRIYAHERVCARANAICVQTEARVRTIECYIIKYVKCYYKCDRCNGSHRQLKSIKYFSPSCLASLQSVRLLGKWPNGDRIAKPYIENRFIFLCIRVVRMVFSGVATMQNSIKPLCFILRFVCTAHSINQTIYDMGMRDIYPQRFIVLLLCWDGDFTRISEKFNWTDFQLKISQDFPHFWNLRIVFFWIRIFEHF